MTLAATPISPMRAAPWRPLSAWLACAVLAMVALTGCDDEAGDAVCRINSDCAINETCVQGTCLVLCRESRDCRAGETCIAGRCEQPHGGNCADDTDCRNGEACISGICELSDTAEPDVIDTMLPGDTTPPQDAGDTEDEPDDTAAPQDTTPPQDSAPGDTTPPQDTVQDSTTADTTPVDTVDDTTDTAMDTTDTAMDTTLPLKGYGESCAAAAECQSNLCVGGAGGVGTCTKPCLSRSDCAAGADACIAVSAMEKVCAPDDTGTACSAPSQCTYQACIQSAGDMFSPDAFCSLPCSSAGECGAGRTCSPMRCVESNGQRFCLPTLVPFLSPNREQLLADYPVDARYCVPIGQPQFCPDELETQGACANALCDADNQICTGQCFFDADCPSPLSCEAIDVSDSRIPLGICHQLP